MKNGNVHRSSNGSPNLLSNVSFEPDSDEDITPKLQPRLAPKHDNDVRCATEEPSKSPSTTKAPSKSRSNRTTTPTRSPRGTGAELSASYQRLLDRSSDLESPLQQFAQKHGFQLPINHPSDQLKSPTPDEVSGSELTKITPRTDFNLSPRQTKAVSDGTSSCAQSYVISTAYTPETAKAAGIPVVKNSNTDSSTDDVTFTSITDDEGETKSPIAPIPLAGPVFVAGPTDTPTTSFVDLSMTKSPSSVNQSGEVSTAAPTSSLKKQFEQQKKTIDSKEGMQKHI